MMKFFRNSRSFITSEKDVTTILKVINKHTKYTNGKIGNCGWADQPEKWFVMFDVSGKRYNRIVKDLIDIGTIRIDVRPGGIQDLYFKRA